MLLRSLVFLLSLTVSLGFVLSPKMVTFKPRAQFDGPYCHSCEMIINDVKADYNYNFKHVGPGELLHTLDEECDKNFGGNINRECREIAANNINVILFNLQQGHTAYFICLTITPPLC